MVTPASSPVTLVRQLGIVSATALVVSNMIGTGIFASSGFLAGDLGDPTLFLLIWVVGAVAALAAAIAANAPLTVRAAKAMVHTAARLPLDQAWDEAERQFAIVYRSLDAQEGPRAFRERRPPRWRGV